jgi:hypothetical protein
VARSTIASAGPLQLPSTVATRLNRSSACVDGIPHSPDAAICDKLAVLIVYEP